MSDLAHDYHYDEDEMVLIFEDYVRDNQPWLNFDWDKIAPRYLVSKRPSKLWRGQHYDGQSFRAKVTNATTSLRNAVWFADERVYQRDGGAIYALRVGGRMLSLKRVPGMNTMYKDDEIIVEDPEWVLHHRLSACDIVTAGQIRRAKKMR